jgi:ribosomal protein S18 acetylase RimI-like enzyme
MIRRLGPDDAAAYRAIRLESLRDAPDAYGSVHADWANAPVQTFADRTRSGFVVGAFDGDVLVGLAAMDREKGGNTRHRALVTAVYVRPEARGRGMTVAMMDFVAAHAVAEGIMQLELHVLVTNAPAIRAYEAAGFDRAGLCPRSILSRGQFLDEMLMVRRLDV